MQYNQEHPKCVSSKPAQISRLSSGLDKHYYRNVSNNFISIIIDNFNNDKDLNWLKKKGYLNEGINMEYIIEQNELDIFLWVLQNIDNINMEQMVRYAIFYRAHNILHYLATNVNNFVDCIKSYSDAENIGGIHLNKSAGIKKITG